MPGTDYADAPINPDGDVVTGINEQIDVLKGNSSRTRKALALKILTHLLGDLHQPLHLGHASDRGGNEVKIKFFDNETKLHSAWDS